MDLMRLDLSELWDQVDTILAERSLFRRAFVQCLWPLLYEERRSSSVVIMDTSDVACLILDVLSLDPFKVY